MTKAIATKAFDYGLVDKDTKGKLVALAGQVNRHRKAFMDSGLEIGEAIHEAHELLAGDGRDGKFKQWVESETGLSSTTAYDWMHAYRRSKKFPVIGNFPPTVACILSAPTVGDGAVKEAEKAVNRGEKITIAKAKELADKFRAAVKRSSHNGAPAGNQRSFREPETSDTSASQETTTGECPKGGDHQWGPDDDLQEGRVICLKCFDPAPDAPSTPEPEPPAEPPAGKLFSKLLEHLRQSVLLLDEINKAAPNPKARQEIFDSLECANQDILKWRKAAK